MPYKDPEKRKAYHKAYNKIYYADNRDYFIVKAKNQKKRKREWFERIKADMKCQQCGTNHPATLDFHHHEDNKLFTVSEGLDRYSEKKMLDEIAKCEVLCANCHRIHHWDIHKKITPGSDL